MKKNKVKNRKRIIHIIYWLLLAVIVLAFISSLRLSADVNTNLTPVGYPIRLSVAIKDAPSNATKIKVKRYWRKDGTLTERPNTSTLAISTPI